jgi:hypothetical protein
MTDQVERYCKVHKTGVKIRRMPDPGGGRIVLLACEHSFLKGVFECKEKCAYDIWAQMSVGVAVEMGARVPLNADGTIPLGLLKEHGLVDYTSEMPKRTAG